ncbi:MAG: haloacid dehalogenase type II [Betaproteobacteria bacterium]
MNEKFALRALAFDAYGTLYDVHSIGAACEALFPGKGMDLSRLWRTKQLEYTWLRSLMGRYEAFETITTEALRFCCRTLGLPLTQSDTTALLQSYRNLALFPEVRDALDGLQGRKKAILSNGSPAMLNALVKNSGVADSFDAVISVDELRIYKPWPAVYDLVTQHLGVARSEVGFVSSNFWDICGATSFGFRTFWINRTGAPRDELGQQPYREIRGLDELKPFLD